MPKYDTHPLPHPLAIAPERLVSIESQSEFDLFTGERQERLFLKLYVAARTSGLLAAISDRDWKTLCVLATYMDATGFCFPSQPALARAIGCSRQMVSERVNSLARFRFQDQPVLIIANEKHKINGRFSHNGYRILPLASLGIFDGEGESGTTERRKQGPKATVSRKPDTVTVSSDTGTVHLDTHKNQTLVNEIAPSNIRKTNRSKDDFVDTSPSQWISPGRNRSVSQRGAETQHDVEDLGSIMMRVAPQLDAIAPVKRSRGRPRKMPNVSPEIYEAVVGVMQDYTRKLGDGEHLASNITQAVNLIVASGCDFNTFYMHVIDAYKITSQRNGLENRSGYFFTVLRDSLLPSDPVATPTR
ncbi:MAG: helix-turn-helix domain-containing protein [Chloroflexota bacterium]|nr:helix-turn-helix domain-containing protein [Chloroflexota bacterium]